MAGLTQFIPDDAPQQASHAIAPYNMNAAVAIGFTDRSGELLTETAVGAASLAIDNVRYHVDEDYRRETIVANAAEAKKFAADPGGSIGNAVAGARRSAEDWVDNQVDALLSGDPYRVGAAGADIGAVGTIAAGGVGVLRTGVAALRTGVQSLLRRGLAADGAAVSRGPAVEFLPAGEKPYQLKLWADEAYDRVGHYGKTPTAKQKLSVPENMEFDHDPPVVKHYYEGPGNGRLPGFNLTHTERRAWARDVRSGRPATPAAQRAQGGILAAYSRHMKRWNGLE